MRTTIRFSGNFQKFIKNKAFLKDVLIVKLFNN